MRQFVFGLLAAAVVFWMYSLLAGDPASAGPDDGTGGAGQGAGLSGSGLSGGAALDQLRGGGEPGAVPPGGASDPAGRPQPLDASSGGGDRLLDEARKGLAGTDPVAAGRVWQALAASGLQPATRGGLARVANEAVAAWKPEDAAAAVARLGEGNAFLHSAEGRAAADRAAALVFAQADDVAVDLASRLLGACMRGPIEKAHAEAKATVDRIYLEHRKRVDRWLCSPTNLTRARSYKVKRGDSLEAIVGRFRRDGVRLDAHTLAVLNRIHNPNALQADQQLKVPVDPVRTVVVKSSYLMAVYVGESVLRLYWVGLGANDKTPVAEFTVSEKIERPDWYSPDGVIPFGHPKNILGNFFVKLRHPAHQGFGVHGTVEPGSIGTQASDGCIRMLDDDIADYFRLVPRESSLSIVGG